MADVMTAPWWPPGVDWKEWRVPPPANSYVRQDDYLAVTVLTSSTTTNLALRYRILTSSGNVHDGAESLDGASENTLKTFLFQLTEGFLLSCTASNVGGGLADNVCGVVLALQKGGQTSTPPHTILAQGFVSNIVGVTWPVGLPRGPATGSSLANGSAAGDLIQWDGSKWAPFAANATGTKVLQESSAGVASWVDPLAVWPGLANHPDRPPATANAMDDEFDAGTLNTSTLWTWENQGSATATLAKSRLLLAHPTPVGSTDDLHIIRQAVPAGNWTFTAKLNLECYPTAYDQAGIVVKDATLTRYLVHGPSTRTTATAGTNNPNIGYFTAVNTLSSYLFGTSFTSVFPLQYFAVQYDGSNLIFLVSSDGVTFWECFRETATTHLTNGPGFIGLAVCPLEQTAKPLTLVCDWFRRTA